MCHYARLARRAWLTATTTCVISALLLGTSSLTAPSASANELRQQGRQHHGGGGGRGFGAVGIGLGIGGMVFDQMQRQRIQQPKAVSSRPEGATKKGGMNSGSSAKKTKGNPSVAKKQGVPNVAKKQDDPVPTNRPPEGSTPPGNPPTQVSTPVAVVPPVNPGAPPVNPGVPPVNPGAPPSSSIPTTPANGTPVQAPPPTPVSVTPPNQNPPASTGPCPDHVAEVTNAKRVFHRLFVVSEMNSWSEFFVTWSAAWTVRSTLTGEGMQARGSRERAIFQPTVTQFENELKSIMQRARPCEEITLFIGGHGAGGYKYKQQTTLPPDPEVPIHDQPAEVVTLNKQPNGAEAILSDRYLGKLVRQNLKPNVSFTLIITACYGSGFAGIGNIEESGLVQVIGYHDECKGDEFDNAIVNVTRELAGKAQDGRVTAGQLKDELNNRKSAAGKYWITAPPADTPPTNPWAR